MSTPRGIRNNNPLNIRINGTKWEGLCPVQTDKSFFQFRTMAHGYRAAIKTHQIELLKDSTIEKAAAYEAEWVEFNAFRERAKAIVDGWLKP